MIKSRGGVHGPRRMGCVCAAKRATVSKNDTRSHVSPIGQTNDHDDFKYNKSDQKRYAYTVFNVLSSSSRNRACENGRLIVVRET